MFMPIQSLNLLIVAITATVCTWRRSSQSQPELRRATPPLLCQLQRGLDFISLERNRAEANARRVEDSI
jgi:hypothetical protein